MDKLPDLHIRHGVDGDGMQYEELCSDPVLIFSKRFGLAVAQYCELPKKRFAFVDNGGQEYSEVEWWEPLSEKAIEAHRLWESETEL